MLANYGYKDGSGDWFITIDTDKCDGCDECVNACTGSVFEVGEDLNDPLRRAGGVRQGVRARRNRALVIA